MWFARWCVLFSCLAAIAPAATEERAPRPSPDFAINLNDGTQIHLSQYRGKVTVVAFILTYCPHCQFTVEILSRLNKEYAPRGFQVVASAIEDMASMVVPDFIKKFQPGFPVGYNQRTDVIEYLQHPPMYRLLMPQVAVIDRKGMIRAQFAGDDKFFDKPEQEKNFRALIEPLLKEGTAAEGHHKRGGKKG
ncbi:MAG TPA: TlpA disulfide reductase family protein [Bryobacteraceae bacterium]|nr:TlpA disulfide reductase family protein [Bryobacteraceae bacterium]